MKKLITITLLILTFVMLFSFGGCDKKTSVSTSAGGKKSDSNTDGTSENSVHSHKFGKWEKTMEATCEQEGTMERKCSCGEAEILPIDPIGHSWVEANCETARYCTNCNEITGQPLGHTTDNGYCENCLECIFSPDKIGRILDKDEFVAEMSKRIDFSKYNVTQQDDRFSYTVKSNKYKKVGQDYFEIKLGGNKFSIPYSIQDLLNAGWEIAEIDPGNVKKLYLDGTYSHAFIDFENADGKKFDVYAEGGPSKLRDCTIKQLNLHYDMLDNHSAYNLNPEIIEMDFKGINSQSSLDDVIAILGEPGRINYSGVTYNGSPVISSIQMAYYFRNDAGVKAYINFDFQAYVPEKEEGTEAINHITSVDYYLEKY